LSSRVTISRRVLTRAANSACAGGGDTIPPPPLTIRIEPRQSEQFGAQAMLDLQGGKFVDTPREGTHARGQQLQQLLV